MTDLFWDDLGNTSKKLILFSKEMPDIQKDLIIEDRESHDMGREDNGLKYELKLKVGG